MIDIQELAKMLEESDRRCAEAKQALMGIEEFGLFFSAIATIVDDYAIVYEIPDEEVEKMYRKVLEVRPSVVEAMKGGK